MDGKDSVGRRISLLNEDSSAPANSLPSLEPGLRSRTSSYTSSPCMSPQTPQLLRSDSTDSAAMSTPSPVTPSFDYPEAQSPANMPYYIPNQPQHYSHPQSHPQANPIFVRQPGTERQPMPAAQPRTKKNQYPCPLAAQYNCNDYFTTSGHAARHAKKHTGKKDAICPDCRKAFTRKDNMEQHRRTHQNGRNARNASKADEDGRVKKTKAASRPKPSPLQSIQAQVQAGSLVDPGLPISPTSSFSSISSAVQSFSGFTSPQYHDNMSYPPPEHYQLNPATPSTFGLETLALAAGGQRKFEA
ncbi:hypothetical protein B0J12DRAFT_576268 [Macrophomina phaseolina]|uniref:C2H2-type domain-containing protein n=1 Tax=Macrophomina phaseolina TaxID=35725 RepID=A0ABQ8G9U8_9PEZI|nr:hypothetical protein B0J12DRAFT_576268 [Macrophomina phaseolina]